MPRKAKAAAPATVPAPSVRITDQCGGSPDGLIEPDGAIEVKCPRPANHWAAWRHATGHTGLEAVPAQHRAQLLHAFLVGSGTIQWIDWVSYCPLFPDPLQLLSIRVRRAECAEAIVEYRLALDVFLNELDNEVQAMTEVVVACSEGETHGDKT